MVSDDFIYNSVFALTVHKCLAAIVRAGRGAYPLALIWQLSFAESRTSS